MNYLLADGTHSSDEVKWTRTIENYARALDLYLALENAYKFWDEPDYDDTNSDTLLTSSQKETVLRANTSFRSPHKSIFRELGDGHGHSVTI